MIADTGQMMCYLQAQYEKLTRGSLKVTAPIFLVKMSPRSFGVRLTAKAYFMKSMNKRPFFWSFLVFIVIQLFVAACTHNRVVDINLESTNKVISNAVRVNSTIAIVIYPEFKNYVYEHHDSNWLITFRMPLGAYVTTRLINELSSRQAVVNLSSSMQELTKYDRTDYVLIPEFGPSSYSTPVIHAYQDAQFSTQIKVRILDGNKREVETVNSAGNSVGTFGRGGEDTNLLVQSALDKAIKEVIDKLLALFTK